jgi:hypothetical protein
MTSDLSYLTQRPATTQAGVNGRVKSQRNERAVTPRVGADLAIS